MTEPLASASRALSNRELNVLFYAAHGCVDKEIADRLDLRIGTVRTYWDRLKMKFKARNRTHAVCLALALGLIQVDIGHLTPGGMPAEPPPCGD